MKKFKKWIAFFSIFAMVMAANEDLNAVEYVTDAGGSAYEDAYQSSRIAPAIALALVAIAAIIAVGVQNRSSHSHSHSHSHDK